MLRLSRIGGGDCAEIHIKLEQMSPTGSSKDRAAHALLERAEQEGKLAPGGAVVEATSGNMGISLAWASSLKGYRAVISMPESMSLERRDLLRGYGAKLHLTPAERHMQGAIDEAKRQAEATPGSFSPSQYQNAVHPEVHWATTGEELIASIEANGGRIDAFVATVGSGATLTGVATALKKRFPQVQVVAVEPEKSPVLSGGTAAPHRIQGGGPGFVAPIVDRSVIDRIVSVDDAAAWKMKRRLAREEGLLGGISTGANVEASVRLGAELGPQARIYTLCADTGERYFSMAERFTS